VGSWQRCNFHKLPLDSGLFHKLHHRYSYSRTRGLFGGLSIEGSVIVERQDANAIAYKSPVTVRILLGGVVDPPPWAASLIKTLEACTGMPGTQKWVEDSRVGDGRYLFSGAASPVMTEATSWQKKGKNKKLAFPPPSWGDPRDTGSYFSSAHETEGNYHDSPRTEEQTALPDSGSLFESRVDSQPSRHNRFTRSLSHTSSGQGLWDEPDSLRGSLSSRHSKSQSTTATNPFSRLTASGGAGDAAHGARSSLSSPYIEPKPELSRPLRPQEGVGRAIALYNFKAVEVSSECVLSVYTKL